MAPQSSSLALAPRRDHRGMESYHSYPQQASQQRQNQGQQEYQYQYAPSSHTDGNSYSQSTEPSNQEMAYHQSLYESLLQPQSNHEQSHFGSSYQQTAYDSPYAVELQSRYDSQPQPSSYLSSSPQWTAFNHSYTREEQQSRFDSLFQPQGFNEPNTRQQQTNFGSAHQTTAFDYPYPREEQESRVDSLLLQQGLDQQSNQYQQPSFDSSSQQTTYNIPYTLDLQSRYDSHPGRQGFGQPSTYQQSDIGSWPQNTGLGPEYALEQHSRYDSQPQWQGFDQPSTYQQSDFGSWPQNTGLGPEYALEQHSRYDSQPQWQGFDQPSTYQQSDFGSWPQHTGLSPGYALEQHSRYDSQPQWQSFDQPPVQHQPQPPGFEHREPVSTGPQFGYQQPPPAFQPVETAHGRPTNQISRPRGRRSRSASPAPSEPAGSDFDDWTKDELQDWNRAHKLPTSRNKAELIEQAKTGRPVKTTNRRKNDRGKYTRNPIERELVPEGIEYHYTDPELSRNLDDANGPGVRNHAYYSYELSPPVVEEESAMHQAQVE